jgi:hypothetical protein
MHAASASPSQIDGAPPDPPDAEVVVVLVVVVPPALVVDVVVWLDVSSGDDSKVTSPPQAIQRNPTMLETHARFTRAPTCNANASDGTRNVAGFAAVPQAHVSQREPPTTCPHRMMELFTES